MFPLNSVSASAAAGNGRVAGIAIGARRLSQKLRHQAVACPGHSLT